MKIVDNFRFFNKIKRKYYKKNSVKRYWKYNGKRGVSYWFDKDFVGFMIKTPELFNDLCNNSTINQYLGEDYVRESKTFLTELLTQFQNNTNNGVDILVTNTQGETRQYLFYGYLLTNRDIYYYILDEEQMQYFLLPFANKVELIEKQ